MNETELVVQKALADKALADIREACDVLLAAGVKPTPGDGSLLDWARAAAARIKELEQALAGASIDAATQADRADAATSGPRGT